jgi:hypothetical protein
MSVYQAQQRKRTTRAPTSLSQSLILAYHPPPPPSPQPDGPAEEADHHYDNNNNDIKEESNQGKFNSNNDKDHNSDNGDYHDDQEDESEAGFQALTLFSILSSPQRRPAGGLKVKIKAGFLGGSTPDWGLVHHFDHHLHHHPGKDGGGGCAEARLQCAVAFPGVELMAARAERNRTAVVRTKYASAVSAANWRYHMPCTVVLHHLHLDQNEPGRRVVMMTRTAGQVLVVAAAVGAEGFVVSLWRVSHHSMLAQCGDDGQSLIEKVRTPHTLATPHTPHTHMLTCTLHPHPVAGGAG